MFVFGGHDFFYLHRRAQAERELITARAQEAVSGNLIFRTLLLLCGAQSYGAPVLMDRIFVDSSRARGSFDGPVMLASAMAGMREKRD